MPSSKNYKRDYKQERKTAKRRKETGVGSKSGDATRHRDRRKYIRENGALSKDEHIHHSKKGAKGKVSKVSAKKNLQHGGKIGSKAGKRKGAIKGHRRRRRKKS